MVQKENMKITIHIILYCKYKYNKLLWHI